MNDDFIDAINSEIVAYTAYAFDAIEFTDFDNAIDNLESLKNSVSDLITHLKNEV